MSNPRRAQRLDANHHACVYAAESLGCVVAFWGVWDLIVFDASPTTDYWGQRMFLLEVKDGAKPPSARRLTPDEWRFAQGWPGPGAIVLGPLEVRDAIEQERRGELQSARRAAEFYRNATEPGWRQREMIALADAALGGGRRRARR